MANIKFYYEWLPLDKNDFRILALLAGYGEIQGNFSDLCSALTLSKSGKNNKRLKESITHLVDEHFIYACVKDNQLQMTIIPKENEINISRERFEQIYCKKFQTSIAWQNVLKVYLWINYIKTHELVVRAEIAGATNISESSITSATNVLQNELFFVQKNTEKTVRGDKIITLGQTIVEGIDFSQGTFSAF